MISGILFDADGVIQQHTTGWRAGFSRLIDPDADLDAFMQEVFAAERPCLAGEGDFVAAFARVLSRWNSQSTLEEGLRVFIDIKVHDENLRLIRQLRTNGMGCYIASNQNVYRAAYMTEVLGYQYRFDAEFYSCDLGVTKPDPAYFRTVIRRLDRPAEQLLFLDDKEANVLAARQVGLHAAVYDVSEGVERLSQVLSEHGVKP